MSDTPPEASLSDPMKLARLSPEQREHVADRLAEIHTALQDLLTEVDQMLAVAEPTAEPQPDPKEQHP